MKYPFVLLELKKQKLFNAIGETLSDYNGVQKKKKQYKN